MSRMTLEEEEAVQAELAALQASEVRSLRFHSQRLSLSRALAQVGVGLPSVPTTALPQRGICFIPASSRPPLTLGGVSEDPTPAQLEPNAPPRGRTEAREAIPA